MNRPIFSRVVALGLAWLAPVAFAAPAKPAAKTAVKKTATKTNFKKSPAKKAPAKKTATKATAKKTAPAKTPVAQPQEVVEEAPKFATWALLVGVSKYIAPQVTSLRFPAADARGIRDALQDKKLGNVPADHIKLLTDEEATRDNILGAVDTFLKDNVKSGDHVIVFLAGHGVAKGVGTEAKSFLLPTDVKGLSTAALESSAVDLKVLSGKLAELPAAQFVQFVDACREDPTPGRAGKPNALSDVLSRGVHIVPRSVAQNAPRASSVTFFACAPGQRAFEDATLNHGVFTYWILDAIRAAAIPQRPDGAVDMGRLASYVSGKVGTWAKEASNNGDFEIEQTPEMIASDANGEAAPVVLMRVRRTLPETPIPAGASKLTLITVPAGAQVKINNANAGVTPLVQDIAAGQHTFRIESPGYEASEKTFQALDGYPQRLVVKLVPKGRGVSAEIDTKTNALLSSALEAEARQNWREAESGYIAALSADAKFAPAYERLADLQLRQNRNRDAVNTLMRMGAQTPATSHAYSLLSGAFSTLALQGEGIGNTDAQKLSVGPFKTPTKPGEAADFARRAANEAIKAEANRAEANRALGMAIIAGDKKGDGRREALAALEKAVALDAKDAANHFALGFGIRFFTQFLGEAERKAQAPRAIAPLREAIALRPDYYEAHRELAYCLHLAGDAEGAIDQYELANANRGAARDQNEVAGNSVALAALHQQQAQSETGANKQRHNSASAAYMDDAREFSKNDLANAVKVLGMIGLKSQLTDFLPAEYRQFLDVKGMINSRIQEKIGDKIKIPRFGF